MSSRSVSQILYAIIRWIAVDVQDFHSLWARAEKSKRYQLMNRPSIFSVSKHDRQMTGFTVSPPASEYVQGHCEEMVCRRVFSRAPFV